MRKLSADSKWMEGELMFPSGPHALRALPLDIRGRVRTFLAAEGVADEERFCRVGRYRRDGKWYVLFYRNGEPHLLWSEAEDHALGGFRLGFIYEREGVQRLPLRVSGGAVWVVTVVGQGIMLIVDVPLDEFREWVKGAMLTTPGHTKAWDGL